MKLDVNAFKYLSDEDFRVLNVVEMEMRNHEIVPSELICNKASLKHGGTYKVLKNLLKNKLLHHDASKYDGYRLTYLGYDFLAMKTLVKRGVFASVGRQIGVGKESDIFEVATEDGTILAMKLHRLGRVSFRAVKAKRDYLQHESSYNWLYLSRLSALKEFAFMKALEEHGFPVPNAVDSDRHCVIMSVVQGYPLVQVKELGNPDTIFETIIGLVIRLAEHGLIHCDFNEFNIMIDDNEKVTMIDFPQMVSVSHRNAKMYFDRDVECIYKFFNKRYNICYEKDKDEFDGSDEYENGRPSFSSISSISKSTEFLDRKLAASGFTKKAHEEIEKFIEGGFRKQTDYDEEEDGDDEDDDDDESIDRSGLPNDNGDADIASLVSLHLVDLKETIASCDDKNAPEENELPSTTTVESNEPEILQEIVKEEEDHVGFPDEKDLVKRLNKQRRRAITAAHGRRKSLSSRNSYKDKGCKASANKVKLRKQLGGW